MISPGPPQDAGVEVIEEPGAPVTGAPQQTPVAIDASLASPEFLDLISRDFARQHLILSQGHTAGTNGLDRPIERFVVADYTNPAAVFNVGVRLHVEPETMLADPEAIARAIDEAYEAAARHIELHDPALSASSTDGGGSLAGLGTGVGGAEIDRLIGEANRDLLSTLGKGPIVKLVDAMLFEALGRGASDIHIHPLTNHTLVRYRLDGVLHTARQVPRSITQSLTSRIKVMARMDIAERRMPQDGRASVTIGDRSIDLRISTLPTSCGERVVIRLLDNSQHLGKFAQLGMPADVEAPYLERAGAASGMILLTGPTGSGKTTTLYTTLRTIGSAEVNIMTIEDPVEYELQFEGGAAISQSQVNSKKGITFATGLRHILRQDPDIVMVGEIRDGETARIAIQSSLTGHLVFSTLHTNDAASAITRLMDLGVEPYLVSASLSCVLAQRLVRTLHIACRGAGCLECLESGFRGRTGLFELLLVDEPIRELIASRAPLSAIRTAVRQSGPPQPDTHSQPHAHSHPPMRTLAEDGQRLVDAGITDLLEVQRVVQGAS